MQVLATGQIPHAQLKHCIQKMNLIIPHEVREKNMYLSLQDISTMHEEKAYY